jgi:hypothetical protein
MDIRRQVTMAANKVSSSIQGDQVPIVGRRPRRTRVIGTILVVGLILGMLAVPVGSVSADVLEDPCLPCVAGSSVAAGSARFSDSGAAALLAAGREIGAGISAARFNDSGVAEFYAAESAATAVRFSDSGAAALLAAPAAAATDAWYDGLVAFYAAKYRPAAVAVGHNDSGVAVAFAAP